MRSGGLVLRRGAHGLPRHFPRVFFMQRRDKRVAHIVFYEILDLTKDILKIYIYILLPSLFHFSMPLRFKKKKKKAALG